MTQNNFENICLPESPREIDPAQTLNNLVTATATIIEEKNTPGFLIGISGTDSILAFLVCARAFEKLGKPDRVRGVHYAGHGDAGVDGNWFAEKIVPWLREQAPSASIVIDTSIDARKDGLRWGDLYDRAVIDVELACPLPVGGNYWVVSATNATEKMLGTYSNASMGASFQPIDQLWKSEVLQLCDHLGVPGIALSMSRKAHVVCGRCQFLAGNIDEIDEVLMVRAGQLDKSYLTDTHSEDELSVLESFVARQMQASAFKEKIPYLLSGDDVVALKLLANGSFRNLPRPGEAIKMQPK